MRGPLSREAIAAELEACADQLDRATGLKSWVIRAYILATWRGSDVREACMLAHFGADHAADRPAGQLEAAKQWVRRLDGARVKIPTRAEVLAGRSA